MVLCDPQRIAKGIADPARHIRCKAAMGSLQATGPPIVERVEMNPNDLLLWLSARGSGTWSRFRAAIDELMIPAAEGVGDEDACEDAPDVGLPICHRFRLNLERLAHVEFFREGFQNGWRIVPPTLACAETEEGPVGVLCGARTDHLLKRIRETAKGFRIADESQPECPDRIEIRANDSESLQRLAASVGLHVQPSAARVLLAATPPVDDFRVRCFAEVPFGDDWEVSRFSVESLGWAAATAHDARSASVGLFRFQVAFQPQYYLRLRGRGYRIPVQVGKYMILAKRHRRVVSYDPDTLAFSVPLTCRPPLLIDRALTLCSGLIPAVDGGRLVYRNVTSAIALAASNLLRQ